MENLGLWTPKTVGGVTAGAMMVVIVKLVREDYVENCIGN